MRRVLAFDVYGTLIDPHGVVALLETMVGDRARAFSQTWREKQLEYTFRRGLMRDYQDFSICTSQALEHTCRYHQCELTDEQKQKLLRKYQTLPPFDDAFEGLAQLQHADFELYAFSNGLADGVHAVLDNAGIRGYFLDIISVDEVKTYKPNPDVYYHFLRRTKSDAENAWMVSSNPFDVIGAISAGMKAAWVQRSGNAVFDPWGVDPTVTVENLLSLSIGIRN